MRRATTPVRQPRAAWTLVPFDEAIRDETGGNPKVPQGQYLGSGALPVVDQGQSEVGGYTDDLDLACRVPLPVILFGDHTKHFKFRDEPFALGADGVKVLVPVEGVDARYAFHYLRQIKLPDDAGYSRHFKFLKRERIPLPPLPEQRRIAAILDQADAIRRKRREALGLVEKLAASAFLEMFGDPVRNPKGWPVRKLADFADSQYGTAAKANTEGRGIPVLRMGNITYDGRIDLTDVKWCEIAPDEMASYTVRRGDLLFNRTNSPELVGKTAVWNRDETFAFAGYLVRVRFQPGLLPEYVSGFLNSRYGKKLLFETAKPSNNMSNLNATELLRIRVPVPSSEKQQGFAHIVTALHDVRSHRATALAEADTLFHALAQRAFRGEL